MNGPAIGDEQLAELCEAALHVIEHPVVICDQVTILFANDAAATLLRADSASALIGTPVNDILHPDMHAPGEIRRRVLMESGQQLLGLHAKLHGRDGTVIHVICDVRPIEFAGQTVLVYTCRPTEDREAGR